MTDKLEKAHELKRELQRLIPDYNQRIEVYELIQRYIDIQDFTEDQLAAFSAVQTAAKLSTENTRLRAELAKEKAVNKSLGKQMYRRKKAARIASQSDEEAA